MKRRQPDTTPPTAERIPLNELFAFEVHDCVAYGRVPETRLREAVASGELPVCRYGGGPERGRYVILRADFERWLLGLRRPPLGEVEP
jgi:hypothetical protein